MMVSATLLVWLLVVVPSGIALLLVPVIGVSAIVLVAPGLVAALLLIPVWALVARDTRTALLRVATLIALLLIALLRVALVLVGLLVTVALISALVELLKWLLAANGIAHFYGAAVESLGTIQVRYGCLSGTLVGQLHKAKAAGLPGVAVSHYFYRQNLAKLNKKCCYVCLGNIVGQVAYVQIHFK